MSTEVLKPCPFCGGEAYDAKAVCFGGEVVSQIACTKCGARSPLRGLGTEAAWNQRHKDKSLDDIIAELGIEKIGDN